MHSNQKQTSTHTKNRILNILTGCLLAAISSYGFADQTEPTVLYIDEAGLPFAELLDKISTETGYRIELVGEWPDGRPVDTRLTGIPLEAGLERIIKELGSISYALVFDASDKKVKIVMLQEGTEPDAAVISEPSSGSVEDDSVKRESIVLPNDEPISPPSPTGDPGLTDNQLAAIKEEYKEKQQYLSTDTEITPASEYGPGLTLAEFKFIKEHHDTKSRPPDAIISPPSQLGNGLTEAELDAIKRTYRKQRETEGPSTLIAPSSKQGKGLTLGELEAIKQSHRKIQYSDDTLVSPPSKYGPSLTLGELEAIKDSYNNK